MKKLFSSLLLGVSLGSIGAYAGGIEVMRCEYLVEPISIDVVAPRFTWAYSDAGFHPVKSRVEVASDSLFSPASIMALMNADSADSFVRYEGRPLESRCRYWWRVVARDSEGHMLESPVAWFETAYMSMSDWTASWISDGRDRDVQAAPVLRKSFVVPESGCRDARLYVSAVGYYYMTINGQRVDDSHMNPGFTQYDRRSLYVVHDVSALLHEGMNDVEVVLGNGFSNGQSHDAWGQENAPWRGRPQFLCELFADGRLLLKSDETWEATTGDVVFNNIYSGDHVDGRIVPGGWKPAVVVGARNNNLRAQSMPPIREVETIAPELIGQWGDTLFLFDMGKNIAGFTRLNLDGDEGTVVTVRHGELLKADGHLEQGNIDVYFRPLRSDERFQTDRYVLGGNGPRLFSPKFCYHGFRYAEVHSSRPIKLAASDVVGIKANTDLRRIGGFRCSNGLLNKIFDAAMLSYEGNLHSIPTDCPQREKNGWIADAYAAINLGLLNYDGITFYEKWLRDFIDNQRSDGNIAGIIPSPGWGYGDWPGPVWGAAIFIIPDALMNYYGDSTIIGELYPSMERYIGWIESLRQPDGTINCGIGDWLPFNTRTPEDFTSTLYAYAAYKIMVRMAGLTGHDAADYRKKADEYKALVNEKWFDWERSVYANGSQTAQAIALYWDVVPEGEAPKVAENLNRMVVANDYAVDFGFLGTLSVLRMLTRYGYADTAYAMASRTDSPSWGNWVENLGYTTMPETWTLSPEFHDASLNHVFFGDISAWMTNDLAGLCADPSSQGFSRFIVRPHFVGGLDWAEAHYESVRGLVKVGWKRCSDKEVTLSVDVPAGSSAHIIAGNVDTEVEAGSHVFNIQTE